MAAQYDVQGRRVSRPPTAAGVYYPQPSSGAAASAPTTPSGPAPIDENAYYEAALARRRRGLNSQAQGQLQRGTLLLEGRGLGQSSSALGVLQGDVNQTQAQGLEAAQNDVYGQQFASQQQRASEERSYARQKELQDIQFRQQVALMRLQKKMQGGGGLFGKLAGVAGTILGGPLGGAIGGWLGSKIGGGGSNSNYDQYGGYKGEPGYNQTYGR